MKVVTVITLAWAAGLLVLVVLRLTDLAEVRNWWMAMCGYGIALGLFGIRYCRRRHQAIERDKARGIPQQS